MSLWEKLTAFSEDAFRNIKNSYGEDFPIEVRDHFAAWIEDQDWDCSTNCSHTDGQAKVKHLILQLLGLIKAELSKGQKINFPLRLKLSDTVKKFERVLELDPVRMAGRIHANLQSETAALLSAQVTPAKDYIKDVLSPQICRELHNLAEQCRHYEQRISQLTQWQQERNLLLEAQGTTDVTAVTSTVSKNKKQAVGIKEKLRKITGDIHQRTSELLNEHRVMTDQMEQIYQLVIDIYLKEWLNRQKKTQGVIKDHALQKQELDQIQRYSCDLATRMYHNMLQINNLRTQLEEQNPPDSSNLEQQKERLKFGYDKVTELLRNLVQKTFVLESQPPQVLKTQSKFSVILRSLVGVALNMHSNPVQPKVTASILNEDQVRAVRTDPGYDVTSSGNMVNHTVMMEQKAYTDRYIAAFKQIQLKTIKRADRRGNEVVTEEKFAMIFRTEFQVPGIPRQALWVLSLPLVVTVHGNQECNAQATILWDNEFSDPGRSDLQAPPEVTWRDLSAALSARFLGSCGRGLAPGHVTFLYRKLFPRRSERAETMVTWSRFCRETLPGRNFSFWFWFYQTLRLTREHVTGWADLDPVHGFCSKEGAERALREARHPRTFILRFSESSMNGGLTVNWTVGEEGGRRVKFLAPFTDHDFRQKKLPGLIHDLTELVYVYPAIPKGDVFPPEPQDTVGHDSDGCYIRHMLKLVIQDTPELEAASSPGSIASSNMATPAPPDDEGSQQSSPTEGAHSYTCVRPFPSHVTSPLPSHMNSPCHVTNNVPVPVEEASQDMSPGPATNQSRQTYGGLTSTNQSAGHIYTTLGPGHVAPGHVGAMTSPTVTMGMQHVPNVSMESGGVPMIPPGLSPHAVPTPPGLSSVPTPPGLSPHAVPTPPVPTSLAAVVALQNDYPMDGRIPSDLADLNNLFSPNPQNNSNN